MSFFEELKRRKVFRVAATYAVVAWILMQIGEVTFPALNIPEWVMSTLVVVLLAGFPIVVIFAWVFDKTPQGFIKTDSPQKEEINSIDVKMHNRPFYLQKKNIFLALGVLAGILIGTYGGDGFKSSVDEKSIAVLPFDNYSTAEEDQYFSDGMTEVIIANLAKVKDLKVISRTSVMEYKNTTKKLKEIAKELGVAHILEGSIQRANGRVRVVGQLIDAETDEHIWAETYDKKESDIFELQSDVAIEIANALKSELTDEIKDRISEKLTESTIAYEYYLKGNMFDNAGHSPENLRSAISEYERAISLDPNFAEAHAQLGKMHAHMSWYRVDISEKRLNMSKNAIDKAMKLKPNNAKVRVAHGTYFYHAFRDYGKALAEYTIARDLAPSSSTSHFYIAMIYRRLGDFEKSIEANEKAVEMDPLSTLMVQNLGQTYNAVRRYSDADPMMDRILSINPNETNVLWLKAILLSSKGELKLARKISEKNKSLSNLVNRFKYDYLARDYTSIEKRLSNTSVKSVSNIWSYFPIEYFNAIVSSHKNEEEKAKKYYNSSLSKLQSQINTYPNDPRFHSALGFVYARQGKYDKAIKSGIKATELLPINRDAMFGPIYEKYLAAIYALSEEHDKALNKIDFLINIPGGFHYGELLNDPDFDLLRNEERFQTILKKLNPKS